MIKTLQESFQKLSAVVDNTLIFWTCGQGLQHLLSFMFPGGFPKLMAPTSLTDVH